MERGVRSFHRGLGAVTVTLCTIKGLALQVRGGLNVTTTMRHPTLKRPRTFNLLLGQL